MANEQLDGSNMMGELLGNDNASRTRQPNRTFLGEHGQGQSSGRVNRELQWVEKLPDHFGLSDGGNDSERAALAK
jgi:hypothetical protein